MTSGKRGGPKTGRMIEHERAKVRQAITRREGVTLGGLKIKNLINEAADKAAALRRCPITRSEGRRTSRRSRIPWCACRTSPCTLKDTWRSWTSIRSWCCRQIRE
jgi:hypothetical protein